MVSSPLFENKDQDSYPLEIVRISSRVSFSNSRTRSPVSRAIDARRTWSCARTRLAASDESTAFDGKTRMCSTWCDLSKFVVAQGGVFDARDDLFEQLGPSNTRGGGKAFELLYGGRRSA